LVIKAFNLLQADNVGGLLRAKTGDLRNAQANGIDIPSSDFNLGHAP
jgi:hypothetical protein